MDRINAPLLTANPTHDDWKYFKRQLENYLLIVRAEDVQKQPLLLNSLGRDGLDIYDGLPDPKGTYDEAISRFDTYFDGGSSVLIRRKSFFEARQSSSESVSEYACRLRRLAKDCSFGATQDTLLRDMFVIGIYNNRLGEKLLAEDANTLTFTIALTKAEAFERARSERTKCASASATAAALTQKPKSNGTPRPASAPTPGKQCYRCGGQHLANNMSCPARGVQCNSCKKMNHFSKVCRSRTRQVNSFQVDGRGDNTDSEDPDSECSITSSLNLFASHGGLSKVQRTVVINGHPIKALMDTGASCNVLPASSIPADLITVKPTNTAVRAWGNFPIKVLGGATCNVGYNGNKTTADFLVVDVPANSLALLSLALCQELNMMTELTCAMDSPNLLIEEYKDLFNGEVGLLKTGYTYNLSLVM